MNCTNPNCECKPGTFANLNPPTKHDAAVMSLLNIEPTTVRLNHWKINMKITAQDFETLRGMIEPELVRVPVAEYRKANPTFSDKRVRWDYFHVAGRPALSFLCDTLYKYMNDTHMDTALKAIVGV